MQVSGIGIPSQWLYYYPELFSDISELRQNTADAPATHTIIPTQPIPLSEVILVAESRQAYDLAVQDQQQLVSKLCSSAILVHQNSTLTVTLDDSSSNFHIPRFQVLMTEPTIQGIAVQEFTRFIVLPASEDTEESDDFSDDDVASSPGSEISTELFSESDAESLVIDEAFLASGVINSIPRTPAPTTPNGLKEDEFFAASSSEFRRPGAATSLVLQAEALNTPVSTLHGTRTKIEDPETRVFLRTADLSRVGLFDGDWVSILFALFYYNLIFHRV